MTETKKLYPPEQWAHLKYHFLLEPSGDTPILEWYQCEEMWVEGATAMSPEVMSRMGYRYLAPTIPLTDDDATVERVAEIILKCLNTYRPPPEIARAVIRLLLMETKP